MNTIRLGEIAEINPRKPSSTKDRTDSVSFLAMSDVGEDGTWSVSEQRPVAEVLKGYTYFAKGDVLLAKITPCMENGKATHLADLPTDIGFGSTEFHVIRAGRDLDPKYLFFLLWNDQFRQTAASNMTGSAGQKRVPTHFLQRVPIPLPPLPEQRRIAGILDAADAIRRKRRAAVQQTDALLRSTFLEMFGDPVTNPKGWPVVCLKNVIELVVDYRGRTPPKSPSGIPLLSAANVKNGRIDLGHQQFISKADFDSWKTRGETKSGDLLITTEAPVGEVALHPAEGRFQISRRVMALRFVASALPEYVLQVLLSENWSSRLKRVTRGSTVPRVLKPDILGQPLPLPPIDHQIRFQAIVEVLDTLRTRLEAAAQEADTLFKALVQKAFRGAL